MDFSSISDCFCPLLSIGQKTAIECQKNCAWRNPTTGGCDMSILPNRVLHDPDLLETIRENDKTLLG